MSAPPAGELSVRIRRGGPGGGEFIDYRAPKLPNQTVLDVVTWIQRNAAPDLSYRFSCRVGMCGTCAMMVNGAPRWTCRAHVEAVARDGKLQLAPLRNLPVIKDLVCDMAPFFRKWRAAEGVFHGERNRNDAVAAITAADPRRAEADAAIECINCAACYAACDVAAWNPDYLGPAALNRAWSLVNDARESAAAGARRLRAVSAAGGCQNCHSQHNCAQFCPVELSPARAIAGLKKAVARAVIRGPIEINEDKNK